MRPACLLMAALLLAGCSLGSDDERVTSRQLDTPVAAGADGAAQGPAENRADGTVAARGDAPSQRASGPPAHLDPVAVPVALSPRSEVLDEECWGGETRCGTVLVPQVEGSADLVAIARPHLSDPYWTLHAAVQLRDTAASWPDPYLAGRDQAYRLAERAEQQNLRV